MSGWKDRIDKHREGISRRQILDRSFSHSDVSDSFVTPWTVAHQAPRSMGFPRQEYWSGLPFPPPGGLPNPGMEPRYCRWIVHPLEPFGKPRRQIGNTRQIIQDINRRTERGRKEEKERKDRVDVSTLNKVFFSLENFSLQLDKFFFPVHDLLSPS